MTTEEQNKAARRAHAAGFLTQMKEARGLSLTDAGNLLKRAYVLSSDAAKRQERVAQGLKPFFTPAAA